MRYQTIKTCILTFYMGLFVLYNTAFRYTKRISQYKIRFALFLAVFLLVKCTLPDKNQAPGFEKIRSGFILPTDDNTIWCYWYWIGDDISKEGITKDLEAMKEAGIGGALIGNINPDEKDGKVPILSEEWWEHMVHAVNEGKRIGVDIGAFNCPGWSMSGGPWITADKAMRYLNYSEATITGGNQVKIKLVKPKKEFQDVYVLAFPKNKKEEIILDNSNSCIKIAPSVKNANYLLDGNPNTAVTFPGKQCVIEITSKNAITARSLFLYPDKNNLIVDCELQASVNDKYVTIKKFCFDRRDFRGQVGPVPYEKLAVSIPDTKSNAFRLICNNIRMPIATGFSEIILSEGTILDAYIEKHLGIMHPTPFPAWDSYLWEPQDEPVDDALKLPVAEVIDISDKMDENGILSWDVPDGEWTVMRFGMTPTGTKNHPAAPQGIGYEVDKANRELIRFHYEQYIGEFLKRIPEESKSAFKYVIADSYEVGSQNWTDGFEEKFEGKFGYNPKKYLPVFSGRIVGSVEESERFLWDLRRSVADAVAYEYAGGLREVSNEDNLELWLENYGHWGFPSEFLIYGGQSDLVSGEFWNEGTLGNIECKSASSAAHIYGKPITSAEAFTASARTYVRHPALLKKRGDWSLTEGINHFVLHLYIHQPDDNRMPGVNAWFSTEFNRHNSWFKKSKTYFDYLRRCQHLLQQGKYAADICYFIGENTPVMTGVRNPELPDGYSYDYINAEVILNRLSVKNGKFILPDGMSYSLLVLPPLKTMRPELLAKIEALVIQGGKIYGSAPEKSPSLQNYPESDMQVKELAARMWAGTTEKVKKYGKGFIVDGLELQEALVRLGIDKDVDLNGESSVLWTHRTMPGMEIYFLSNQSDEEISFSPSFRVRGMEPQLWDAITGDIRALNEYEEINGRTTIPIKMKAQQSWFIVFSNSGQNIINASYAANFPEAKIVQTLENPWTVDFNNKNIGPAEIVKFPTLTDWVANENKKIKYYSGTAVYTTTFNYKKDEEIRDVFIHLGNVGVMASVKVNGIDIGTTWIAPFRLNANQAIQDGENILEVEVVNVWRNRITGDKKLSEQKRTTWLLIDQITPDEELIPSGLLGPVTIQVVNEML